MMRRAGAASWATMALVTSCLYTGEIVPPDNNRSPTFTNWLPEGSNVAVGESGVNFWVAFTDEDEEDIDQLEMAWSLDFLDQGNGDRIKIWPEDLGEDGKAMLVATLTDPSGEQDYLVWYLQKDESLSSQGE